MGNLLGLIENWCAALRTKKISEKGANEFRKGGSLNILAELVADGLVSSADLNALIVTARDRVKIDDCVEIGEAKKAFRPLSPFEQRIKDRGYVDVSDIVELIWGGRGTARVQTLSSDQERVRALLGDRFISPEAYAKAFRLSGISEADLAKLAVIPWTDAELMEEMALGSILVPHIEGVTLWYLRKTFGAHPSSQPCFLRENDWWQGDGNASLRDKTLHTGWRLVRTNVEPESTGITWDAQQSLVPETHERTWTLEVVEMCLLSYWIWKIRPLEDEYAWCQDLGGDGYRAYAGNFDRDGFTLHAFHPSNDRHVNGLLLSRKPSQR